MSPRTFALLLFSTAGPVAAQSAARGSPATAARAVSVHEPLGAAIDSGAATVAVFRKSFEISLDGVHWAKSITQRFPYPCTTGGSTLCGAHTLDVRVYTRWAPLPAVDMKKARIQGMTGPYRIDVSSPQAQPVCESGASYPLPSSGFPVTVRASRPGGPFPITCSWVVVAVVARPRGSTPAYELVFSEPAWATFTLD